MSTHWQRFVAWVHTWWAPSQPSRVEVLHTAGFDVLRDESHLALRCQACATDKPWRQAFGGDGQTLPAGFFAYPINARTEQVNLALRIHRIRCAAANTAPVRIVEARSA